jgi:23S rRNA (cytidine2498-2'-O)-methyltransferase
MSALLDSAGGRILFSVATDSFDLAVREIHEEFGTDVRIERVSADLGVIVDNAPSAADLAQVCTHGPIIFIRHLTVELASFDRSEVPGAGALAELILTALPDAPPATLAVQTWTDGSGTGGSLYNSLSEAFDARGIAVVRAGQPIVVSCFISQKSVLIGLNRLENSLSDWPGGRIRLGRSEDRVSRSEFKLEEALQTYSIELPPMGKALDLGASPGGWTRILRQQGMDVWAVDPGVLDPRIAADLRVHHVASTAGNFFRSNQERFDVVVNDMRMDPVLSARVMVDAVPHLQPDAVAIVTLKGGGKSPLDVARRGLQVLSKGYDVLHARQLHYNRREITVIGRRR